MTDYSDVVERKETPRRVTPRQRALAQGAGPVFKRIFDWFLALTGLIVLAPVFLVVGILIRRDSPGPIFYRGLRLGRNGRVFHMVKFRTMYERPESYKGPRITGSEDKRITPFGHWLRHSKVNELPQLWNVLRGEMSFVGPRPEDPEIARMWPEDERDLILSVRPGITSPASIVYHNEEELLTSRAVLDDYIRRILPDKMRLDQLYIRNQSLSSDLDIILCTLAVVIPRLAGSSIPESRIFSGPVLRFTRWHLAWFAVDLVIAFAAVAWCGFLWRSQGPLHWGFPQLALVAFGFAILLSCANAATGLNRIDWSHARGEDAFGLLLTGGLVVIMLLSLNYVLTTFDYIPYPPLPAPMIIMTGFSAQVGFVIARYRSQILSAFQRHWLHRSGQAMGERVLLVGSAEGCLTACWLLGGDHFRQAFCVVGIVEPDDPTKSGMRVLGQRVLGTKQDIPTLLRDHDIRLVLLTEDTSAATKADVMGMCSDAGIHLVTCDNIFGAIRRALSNPQPTVEPNRDTSIAW